MSYWTALFLSDSHQSQLASQWMSSVRRKRKKPRQMTLHLLPLWISPFSGKVTCVCPAAASPGPHRISYLTAMPTQTHTGTAALSRAGRVQIPHWGQIRQTASQASASTPAATNLQFTPQDLSVPGLKGAPYRPRGTATSSQPTWQESSLQRAREEELIKEDLSGFLSGYNN